MSSKAQSHAVPFLASGARISVLLVATTLIAAVLGVLDKQGPFADASEGLFSDLVRQLPFVLVGLVSAYQGRSLKTVALWVIALNLIDKAFVGIRLATFPEIAGTVPASNLLVGVATIWAITTPMAFTVAAALRSVARTLLIHQPRSSSTLSWLLVLCAVGAIVVPITHAINGLVLISLHDIPLFTLSFSYKAVPVLQGLFIVAAFVALALAIREIVVRRRFDAWPVLLVGMLLLVLSVLLSVKLGTFGLWGL